MALCPRVDVSNHRRVHLLSCPSVHVSTCPIVYVYVLMCPCIDVCTYRCVHVSVCPCARVDISTYWYVYIYESMCSRINISNNWCFHLSVCSRYGRFVHVLMYPYIVVSTYWYDHTVFCPHVDVSSVFCCLTTTLDGQSTWRSSAYPWIIMAYIDFFF